MCLGIVCSRASRRGITNIGDHADEGPQQEHDGKDWKSGKPLSSGQSIDDGRQDTAKYE